MAQNLQPTTPYPRPWSGTVDTYALLAGERVWTRSGPRTVVAVEPGAAGGWRLVRFEDGDASVTYTHPWTVATDCDEEGCERVALEGADYCGTHNRSCGAVGTVKGAAAECVLVNEHEGRHEDWRNGELVAAWREPRELERRAENVAHHWPSD